MEPLDWIVRLVLFAILVFCARSLLIRFVPGEMARARIALGQLFVPIRFLKSLWAGTRLAFRSWWFLIVPFGCVILNQVYKLTVTRGMDGGFSPELPQVGHDPVSFTVLTRAAFMFLTDGAQNIDYPTQVAFLGPSAYLAFLATMILVPWALVRRSQGAKMNPLLKAALIAFAVVAGVSMLLGVAGLVTGQDAEQWLGLTGLVCISLLLGILIQVPAAILYITLVSILGSRARGEKVTLSGLKETVSVSFRPVLIFLLIVNMPMILAGVEHLLLMLFGAVTIFDFEPGALVRDALSGLQYVALVIHVLFLPVPILAVLERKSFTESYKRTLKLFGSHAADSVGYLLWAWMVVGLFAATEYLLLFEAYLGWSYYRYWMTFTHQSLTLLLTIPVFAGLVWNLQRAEAD